MQTNLQEQHNETKPLAVPTLPSATPSVVPSAKAETPAIVTNEWTKSAQRCAEGIIKAEATRYKAWANYANQLHKMDEVPAAAAALQSVLTEKGYTRAQVEASEWKRCAIAMLYDKERALYTLDDERKVPKLDKDGKAIKDSTGKVVMIRPTPKMVLDELASIRDEAVKAGKVDKTVYKPRAVSESTGSNKLSSQQLSTLLDNLKVADDSQFRSIFAHYLTIAAGRADAEGFLSEMVKLLQGERIKRGWITETGEAPAGRTLVKA